MERDRDLHFEEMRQTLQQILDDLYEQGELILPAAYERAIDAMHMRDQKRIHELEQDYIRERGRNRTLSERVRDHNYERSSGSETCGERMGRSGRRARRSSGGSSKFDGWSLGDDYESRDYESSSTCGSSSRRSRSYCGSSGTCGS